MRPQGLTSRAIALSLVLAPWAATLATPVALADTANLTRKLNAAVGCINRLSQRSYESRQRYLSWVGPSGPTGKERIIYGTYTIYDTTDCAKAVAAANELEPREPALEAAASAYVAAVAALEPLLQEADDYYRQENYKDDRMAKGKALHPRLITAWSTFAEADRRLRAAIDTIQDKRASDSLAQIEQAEGRKARWHTEAVMLTAKRVERAHNTEKPSLEDFTKAIATFDETLKAAEAFAAANKEAGPDSSFVNSAKTFLTSAKQLMRRVRDKIPYSSGDKMMIDAGSSWMVEGSPGRVTRDYNHLVDRYNSVIRR